MKIDCIIGIDPGANGGIVTWRPNYNLRAIKMPKDITKIRDYLNEIKTYTHPIVFIEKLSIRPDDVMVGQDGVNLGKLYRIQNMMQNYESLKAIIAACDIPFCMVAPMKWQSTLKLRKPKLSGKAKEEKADRKRRYKDIAGKLYPELKATLWNSDATLIMHFGRYMLVNDMNWVRSNLPERLHTTLF